MPDASKSRKSDAACRSVVSVHAASAIGECMRLFHQNLGSVAALTADVDASRGVSHFAALKVEVFHGSVGIISACLHIIDGAAACVGDGESEACPFNLWVK